MRCPISTAQKSRPVMVLSAWFGIVGLCIGLVGVARSPYSKSDSIQELVAGQAMRMEGLRRNRDTAQELEKSQVRGGLVELVTAFEEALPEAPDEVRIFYLVQLLAHALQMELEDFALGDVEGQGLPVGSSDIGLRSMSLRGTANLSSVLDLLEALRVAGLPLVVQDLQAVRASPGTVEGTLLAEQHKFSLSLSLIERAPYIPIDEFEDGYGPGDETDSFPQSDSPQGE